MFKEAAASTEEKVTTFELETRYGFRGIKDEETSLLLTTFSFTACIVSACGSIIAFGSEAWPLFCCVMFIGFICNRWAVWNAIKLFRSIQLAVADNRDRRPSGWTRHVIALFPLSACFPPCDLISAAALLVFLRRSSDHLSERQHRVFDWAELALAFAFPLQHLYPMLLIVAFPMSLSPGSFAGTTASLAVTTVGLWTIYISLRAMRYELRDLVHDTHPAGDSALQFLSHLQLDNPGDSKSSIKEGLVTGPILRPSNGYDS